MNRLFHNLINASIVCLTIFTSACSMMKEDNDDCPTGLYVRYIYDYNTMRADMFNDHVGHITLYVYDEDGNKVAERSVSNIDQDTPLASHGYTMHFKPNELAPGRYRLQAIGLQRDWTSAQNGQHAKYQRPNSHDQAEDFQITLEHSEQPHPTTGRHSVNHNKLPLDTLWHTLKVMAYSPQDGVAIPEMHRTSAPYSIYPMEEQYVTVTANHATYATVSLIRDTKHLNITLRQLNNKADMSHDRYEVTIEDDNALLGHDNSVIAHHPLTYTPFASWTTRFSNSGLEYESGDLYGENKPMNVIQKAQDEDSDDPSLERTAHFNVMYNRLMYNTDPSSCAYLKIKNKDTGTEVAKINLPYILAQGRTAYEYSYSPQEYLDREHDYHLDFILKGDTWEYCTVMIDVLAWSKRIQKVGLE